MAKMLNIVTPSTLIDDCVNHQKDVIWITGLRLEKYSDRDMQDIRAYFIEPQEVRVSIDNNYTWGAETNKIILHNVKLPNGSILEKMNRYESNMYSIKFFKDEQHAKQYFLLVTKKLYDSTIEATKKYKSIYDELKLKLSSFIDLVDMK